MSGRQSRRRRRAVAAGSRPEVGRGRASPKVLLAGAAVVVLVAVTAGLVSAFGGSGGTAPKALAGPAEVRALFRDLPQHANVLGSPTAPVTLVEYADLQCPHCRDSSCRRLRRS